MANECIPLHEVGPLTCLASAAITGKRFVDVSAAGVPSTGTLTSIAPCAAGAKALGVAVKDAASGTRVQVELHPGSIVPVSCSAAITAGAEVEVAANGQAVTLASGKPVGKAVSSTSGANTDVFVKLY